MFLKPRRGQLFQQPARSSVPSSLHGVGATGHMPVYLAFITYSMIWNYWQVFVRLDFLLTPRIAPWRLGRNAHFQSPGHSARLSAA